MENTVRIQNKDWDIVIDGDDIQLQSTTEDRVLTDGYAILKNEAKEYFRTIGDNYVTMGDIEAMADNELAAYAKRNFESSTLAWKDQGHTVN